MPVLALMITSARQNTYISHYIPHAINNILRTWNILSDCTTRGRASKTASLNAAACRVLHDELLLLLLLFDHRVCERVSAPFKRIKIIGDGTLPL